MAKLPPQLTAKLHVHARMASGARDQEGTGSGCSLHAARPALTAGGSCRCRRCAAVLHYNRALTDTEAVQMESWLARAYNITLLRTHTAAARACCMLAQ